VGLLKDWKDKEKFLRREVKPVGAAHEKTSKEGWQSSRKYQSETRSLLDTKMTKLDEEIYCTGGTECRLFKGSERRSKLEDIETLE